jgi:hypothetical protein
LLRDTPPYQPQTAAGGPSAQSDASGKGAEELQSKWDNDNFVLGWLADKAVAIEASLQALRHERARASTLALGQLQPKGVVSGVIELIKEKLDGSQRQEALAALRDALGSLS